MIYLIGGKGFVGSAYARLFDHKHIEHRLITRDNAEEFRGTACNLLINANGNSKKFLSDRDPLGDFEASVTSVARSLEWYKAERYVLLSSGDVYPDTNSPETTHEDQTIDPAKLSRYGLHKYMAETLVRGAHPRHVIVRMGGFVGEGLKKNAIFDMLNDQTLWLDPNSRLQFINTDNAAAIVYDLAGGDAWNTTVNLGGKETVKIGDVYNYIGSKSVPAQKTQKIAYELSISRLEKVSNLALPRSEDEVKNYVDRCQNGATMIK